MSQFRSADKSIKEFNQGFPGSDRHLAPFHLLGNDVRGRLAEEWAVPAEPYKTRLRLWGSAKSNAHVDHHQKNLIEHL